MDVGWARSQGPERVLWLIRADADPSLTTPKLKKTLGAPCAQDDTLYFLLSYDGLVSGSRSFCHFHPAASCLARSVARMTALMRVTRRPPSSSSRMPSTVQPAGVVTASLSSAGCEPVSSTILAEPKVVCAASRVAVSRGRPTFTPASARASMMM